MIFGYTILYVADVAIALDHYAAAFGFKRRMLHESSLYGKLETGQTVLGFASHEIAEGNNIPMRPIDLKQMTGPANVTFVTPDVQASYSHAIENGAAAVMQPVIKPWGQTIALRPRL